MTNGKTRRPNPAGRRVLCTVALALGLIFLAVPAARADRLMEPIEAEGWRGGAYRADATGDTYCALLREFGSNASIWLVLDELGYFLKIAEPEYLDMRGGAEFDARLQVDDLPSRSFPSYAEDADTLVVDLGNDPVFMHQLATGERLILADWGIWYGLDGSAAAIAALEECYPE